MDTAPVRAVLDTSVLIAHDVPRLDGELAISAASLAELNTRNADDLLGLEQLIEIVTV